MIGARQAMILLASALPALGVAPAAAQLPVSVSLHAKEITKAEAVQSVGRSGSVLKLVRHTTVAHPTGSPGEMAPAHEPRTPTEGRQDAARIHETAVEAIRGIMRGREEGKGSHATGTGEHGKRKGQNREEMEDHMDETPGQMMGHTGMERSRMHETGMMGGPEGNMMSTTGAEGLESMMGPGGGMRGGGAVPEMHHGDRMMGERGQDGMMGGGMPGGPRTGGMHGGTETPGTGGGPGNGGMMGGGG